MRRATTAVSVLAVLVFVFALDVVVTSPPASADAAAAGELWGVSCPAPRTCTAVGDHNANGHYQPLVRRQVGGAWTDEPVTAPRRSKGAVLLGVSCTEASTCAAAGWFTTGKANRTLVEVETPQRSWSIVRIPNVGTGPDQLDGISCWAPGSCVAVGYQTAGGAYQTLVLVDRGGSWAVVPSPDVSATADNALNAVSCTGPSSCTAVGITRSPSGSPSPLVERWNGASWAIVPSAVPDGSSDAELYGVSCAAGACTAVGQYAAGASYQTLVEVSRGSGFAVVTSPDAATSAQDILQAVSCTGLGRCTAVGADFDGAVQRVLVLSESHGVWSLATPSDTSASNFAFLDGVSCATPASCTDVGGANRASVRAPLELATSAPLPDITTEAPGNALFAFWQTANARFDGPLGLAPFGYALSSPSVAVGTDGLGRVAARGPGNSLTVYWQIWNGQWYGPVEVGAPGTSFGAPAEAVGPTGLPTVAVQGGANSLDVYWATPDAQWHGPLQIGAPGTTYSSPSIAVSASGFPTVVAEGPGNSLFVYWETPDAQWHGPLQVAANGWVLSAPSMTTVGDGTLSVAVQGPADELDSYWQTPDAQWHGPLQIGPPGSALDSPSAANGADGLSSVAAEGPQNTLSYFWQTSDAQWHGPLQIGAVDSTLAAPAIGTGPTGLPDVAVEGPANSLWLYWQTPDAQWHGPLGVGAPTTAADAPAISTTP